MFGDVCLNRSGLPLVPGQRSDLASDRLYPAFAEQIGTACLGGLLAAFQPGADVLGACPLALAMQHLERIDGDLRRCAAANEVPAPGVVPEAACFEDDATTECSRHLAGQYAFLELQFLGGTARICSYSNTYTWGGYDWSGLGLIGNISAVEETAGVTSSAMTFGLNIVNAAMLALSVSAVENYRGRAAKLYFCPLNENGALIDTPEICWRGIMDTMTAGADGEDGQVVLKCETSAYGIKRRPSLRLNAAQQKQRYPTDTGLDYLTGLISTPQLWLSAKFQQR